MTELSPTAKVDLFVLNSAVGCGKIADAAWEGNKINKIINKANNNNNNKNKTKKTKNNKNKNKNNVRNNTNNTNNKIVGCGKIADAAGGKAFKHKPR